jgi:3'-5' exonuclease
MDNLSLDQLFVIDIETVSQHAHYDDLSPEWQELWLEKSHRFLPEPIAPQEYYPKRAAILAEFGKVICISMGRFIYEDYRWQFRVRTVSGHNEKELLQKFLQVLLNVDFPKLNYWFAGHNVKEFDIPYLCRRLLANQMAIPPYLDFQNKKPWETKLFDTMHHWRFGDFKHFTSLKLLAACLDVPSPKDDIDGSMVGHVYWQEKNLERIATYCQKDVVTVAQIILRYLNKPLLTEDQIIFK